MKEREISLIDLMFEILLKWRIIIVAMVVGGILLGGYSYWQSVQTINAQQNVVSNKVHKENQEEIRARLENTLTDIQKNNVQSVLRYEEYNASYNEYHDNSILMQIDANNVPTMYLVFNVETPNEKDKIILFDVYSQIINNGIVEWLAENGMDAKEAAKVIELINVKTDVGNQSEALLSGTKGSITVSIIHADEMQCKKLAKEVEKLVLAKETEMEAVYGAIEVKLIEEIYATVANFDVLTKQRTILTNTISGNTSADNMKKVFTEDEKEYYELFKGDNINVETETETEDDETTVEPATVVVQSPSINVTYVILGMVIFAFLYVFFVFVAYILNNKLRASDSMTELYDITQLGVISTVSGKKKFLGFVDALIIRLRDRNKRKFTKEESEEIVAVAIKMAVRKSETNEVSLVGCEVKKQTEDICNNIKALLEKEGIKITILDNVLYNAEEMEKLSDISQVVLIEKTGSTMYDEVEKELHLMKRYSIDVLGTILVD